jgi:outer membrane protein assembly factor BamE
MRILLLLISLIGIYGCSIFRNWHFPYMMEVKQGNYITKEQYSQLHVGLSKNEVSNILGYPLVEYIFKKNQWDLIYQDYKNNQLIKSYSVKIIFDEDGKVKEFSRNGDGLFFN